MTCACNHRFLETYNPGKLTWPKLTNYPIEKETHLPSTSLSGFHANFPGCITLSFLSVYYLCPATSNDRLSCEILDVSPAISHWKHPKTKETPNCRRGHSFLNAHQMRKKISIFGDILDLLYLYPKCPFIGLKSFSCEPNHSTSAGLSPVVRGFHPLTAAVFNRRSGNGAVFFLVPLFKDEKVRRVFGNQHCTMFDQKYVFLDGLSGIQIITEMMESFSKAKNLDCFRQKYIGVDRFDVFFSDVFLSPQNSNVRWTDVSSDQMFVRYVSIKIQFSPRAG